MRSWDTSRDVSPRQLFAQKISSAAEESRLLWIRLLHLDGRTRGIFPYALNPRASIRAATPRPNCGGPYGTMSTPSGSDRRTRRSRGICQLQCRDRATNVHAARMARPQGRNRVLPRAGPGLVVGSCPSSLGIVRAGFGFEITGRCARMSRNDLFAPLFVERWLTSRNC